MITVVASAGILTAGILLLIVIPCSKGYKSVLQRIMIVMVFSMLIEDGCRVTAIFYQPSNTTTAMSRGCTALGAVTVLFHWETFIMCLMWAMYLLVIVCIQTRSDFAALTKKLQASKKLRVMLEIVIYVVALTIPILVLWIPFYDTQLHYGYDGEICSMELVSNDSLINNEDIFIYAPILITAICVACFFVGVTSVYCIMSAKLMRAKEAMRNLFVFSISLVVFFVLIILLSQILNFSNIVSYYRFLLDALYLIITTIGKFGIIIGYFIIFHCTKRKEMASTKYKQQIKAEYGSFKPSDRKSAFSYTYFSTPHTGQFDTSI